MQTIIRLSHTRAGQATLSVEVRNQRRGSSPAWSPFFSGLMGTNGPVMRRRAMLRTMEMVCLLALMGLIVPATVHAQTAFVYKLTFFELQHSEPARRPPFHGGGYRIRNSFVVPMRAAASVNVAAKDEG